MNLPFQPPEDWVAKAQIRNPIQGLWQQNLTIVSPGLPPGSPTGFSDLRPLSHAAQIGGLSNGSRIWLYGQILGPPTSRIPPTSPCAAPLH